MSQVHVVDVEIDDKYEDPQSAVFVGMYASAARCLLQYIVAPLLGAFGFWLPWFGLLVQVLACVITVFGVLQLRLLGDRRWRFSAGIAVVVLGSTVLAVAGRLG